MNSGLTLLNLEQPTMRADYESTAPTGISMSDIEGMEQFLIGVRTHSGQVVTPEKAKRCSAVLACMRGIMEDISCLPLPLFKRSPTGDEHAHDHQMYNMLNNEPNDVMTALEMREHIIMDLMLNGNFYILKNEDPDAPGEISSLWPLQAAYVTRRWREMVWVFTDPVTGVSGTFTPDMVWRGTIMAGNSIDGIGLTLLAREAIGIMLAAEEQGARLFKQGVQTDLALSSTEIIEDKTQLRKAFMERHAGAGNAWMPLILEGGITASKIGLTAQESQYIESRAFQIGDIARIFRYPDVLLGSLGKSSRASTYASAEQFFQSYTKHTLNPWAVRIEQTAHRDLLDSKEKKKYFFRHDFEALLRGDTAARYASYATGIAVGMLAPAEGRRKENLPYVPGLNYYTKPMNNEAVAGQDAAGVKPTDVSGRRELIFPTAEAKAEYEAVNGPIDKPVSDTVSRRVALAITRKEYKAVVGSGQAPDVFYGNFAAFVEELTGADFAAVHAYLETRRTDENRFSTASQDAAVAALIQLCQKDA